MPTIIIIKVGLFLVIQYNTIFIMCLVQRHDISSVNVFKIDILLGYQEWLKYCNNWDSLLVRCVLLKCVKTLFYYVMVNWKVVSDVYKMYFQRHVRPTPYRLLDKIQTFYKIVDCFVILCCIYYKLVPSVQSLTNIYMLTPTLHNLNM